jgi:hypothetical protein
VCRWCRLPEQVDVVCSSKLVSSAESDSIFWNKFEETLFRWLIWTTFLKIFSHPQLSFWENVCRWCCLLRWCRLLKSGVEIKKVNSPDWPVTSVVRILVQNWWRRSVHRPWIHHVTCYRSLPSSQIQPGKTGIRITLLNKFDINCQKNIFKFPCVKKSRTTLLTQMLWRTRTPPHPRPPFPKFWGTYACTRIYFKSRHLPGSVCSEWD